MYKLTLIFLLLAVYHPIAHAQHSITGTFPPLAQQQVRLVGFEGFNIYTIDTQKVSADGKFQLNFAPKDFGMAYLAAEDNKPYFLVLAPENTILKGEIFSYPQSIQILEGKENQLFDHYATDHPKRQQALSAWIYLRKMYHEDPLFSVQQKANQAILEEINRINSEDSNFLSRLDPKSYISWYLPTRKLVSSVSVIAQYRPEEIPATIDAFRTLDHTDHRLFKSGLYKDVIDSHFWLIENSGQSMDKAFADMKISIDHLMEKLILDEKKLNEITDYLFKLLEQHSLFDASEYLALKVLNETSCTLNSDLAKQLESYRSMKKGKIAPDIIFAKDKFMPGFPAYEAPQKLSELKNKYFLIVFAASWCPKCNEEVKQLAGFYAGWKKQGVEVVLISLDDNEAAYKNFVGTLPFISYCDYLKWQSQAAMDYYVFATPSFFLLDSKREILLRPNSVKQVEAWIDWFLVKGNQTPGQGSQK
ncbi:MAG TPA: thioredoxin-like domain-containing protein [Saprospiraceae bacterium]|nr:thioredoxin-like domain-containing protein [Saprospiraceae bacterium]